MWDGVVGEKRRGLASVLGLGTSSSYATWVSGMKPKESKISESKSGLPGHFEGIFVKVRGQEIFYVTNC